MRSIIYLGAALAIVGSATAEAADSQNRFQPYGLGRATCQRFIEICEGKKDECKQTGPWLAGYVTAYNTLDKGTFDVFEWQSPELFAQLVFNVCKQHPEAAVVQVVNEMIRAVLAPNAINTASDRVKIGDGNDALYFYREGIKAIQTQLAEQGFLKGGADGVFGPGSQSAVQEFQKKVGLNPTGMPDDITLMGLFYGGPQPAGNAAKPSSASPAPASAAPAQTSAPPPAKLDLNLIPKTP